MELEKVRKGLWMCEGGPENCGLKDCPYFDKREFCEHEMHRDALTMLKEQEAVAPTINEYGEAYCICGENVGIIPSNKNLPSIRSKYCSECGRRMKWE